MPYAAVSQLPPGMEHLLGSLRSLNSDITHELNSLSELVTNIPEATNIVDTIRMRLESGISEIKICVSNKRAMEQSEINIEPNSFVRTGGVVSVAVKGKEINPRSIQAKAAAVVIWGKNHVLNTEIKNPLTHKTKNSSEMMGFLAIINQALVLNIHRLRVIAFTDSIKNLCQNIEMYAAMNFTKQDGSQMENKFLLERILDALEKAKINIVFDSDTLSSEERKSIDDLKQETKNCLCNVFKNL